MYTLTRRTGIGMGTRKRMGGASVEMEAGPEAICPGLVTATSGKATWRSAGSSHRRSMTICVFNSAMYLGARSGASCSAQIFARRLCASGHRVGDSRYGSMPGKGEQDIHCAPVFGETTGNQGSEPTSRSPWRICEDMGRHLDNGVHDMTSRGYCSTSRPYSLLVQF